MGIMFLVFIPTPYVDASSAWAFPNKWHRMFVGAAGMIFELFVAAVCAFVWANTNPNSLVNQLACCLFGAGYTSDLNQAKACAQASDTRLQTQGYWLDTDNRALRHAVEIRRSLPIGRGRYYLVLLLGRERRTLRKHRQQRRYQPA